MGEAEAVVPIAFYRVESGSGHSLAVLQLRDRRNARGLPPLIKWVYQKQLEFILFGTHGTGALWKLLNQASLGRTTLSCDRVAVQGRLLSDAELIAILNCFKQQSDFLDPCSRNKIRSCVLVPLAAASAVCRLYGRSDASMAVLRAVDHPIPQVRRHMRRASNAVATTH